MHNNQDPRGTSGDSVRGIADRFFLIVVSAQGIHSVEVPSHGRLVVGRDHAADLQLNEPGVADLHCEFVQVSDQLVVRDRGSATGTRVRGATVHSDCVVTSGDLIEVGACRLLLSRGGDFLRCLAVSGHDWFEQCLQEQCAKARWSGESFGVLILEGHQPHQDYKAILVAALRATDVIEEFGPVHYEMLARDASPRTLELIAGRIHEALRQRGLSARLGLALFPGDGRTGDELITHARSQLRCAQPAVLPAADRSHVVIASPAMKAIYATVEHIAAGNIPVLITGETGTGKEVIAEAVHRASPRCDRPLVRVNCAAMPESLLESELFGYEAGAFTGATKAKRGLFEHADQGTILLDEIGDMPANMQSKLLRVLEEKKVRPLGSLEARPIDVRVITSTNCQIQHQLDAGRFRADLYWRIAGAVLEVPPLRFRADEVLPLASHFLAHFAAELHRPRLALSDDVSARLRGYAWPGNVRQLRNVMERAALVAVGGRVELEHLPESISGCWVGPQPRGAAVHITQRAGDQHQPPIRRASDKGGPRLVEPCMREQVALLERQRIIESLEQAQNNQTRAANILGMPRRTFIDKLDRYGIERPRKRP